MELITSFVERKIKPILRVGNVSRYLSWPAVRDSEKKCIHRVQWPEMCTQGHFGVRLRLQIGLTFTSGGMIELDQLVNK